MYIHALIVSRDTIKVNDRIFLPLKNVLLS